MEKWRKKTCSDDSLAKRCSSGECKETRVEGRRNFRECSLLLYLVLIDHDVDSQFSCLISIFRLGFCSYNWKIIIEKRNETLQYHSGRTYSVHRRACFFTLKTLLLIRLARAGRHLWSLREARSGMPKSHSRLSKQFAIIMRTV